MVERILKITLVIVVLLFGGFYAYNESVRKQEVSSKEVVEYITKEVEKGDIVAGVKTSGQIEGSWGGGIDVPDILFDGGQEAKYIIEKVLVERGDPVKEGDTLIKLQSPDLDLKLKEAELKLREKTDDLLLMAGVDNINKISPSQGIIVRATMEGRVTELTVKEGDELEQGISVAKIVNDSKYIVRAKVTPGEYKLLKEGQEVTLKIGSYDGTNVATITSIDKNQSPDLDKDGKAIGFIHWITIEGKNPGLAQPKMEVEVGIKRGGNIFYFVNKASIEGFANEATILASAKGIITKMYAHSNDVVKKGDKIAVLAGEDMQRAIEGKIREIDELKKNINSYKESYKYLEIKSRMNGIVSYMRATEGKELERFGYLGSLYNMDEMYMETYVDDQDVLKVKMDAPVTITLDAIPGEIFEGRVKDIQTRGNSKDGITKFRVTINLKGNEKTKPNFAAKAFIESGSSKDTLLIPLEGLLEEEGKMVVKILQDDKSVKVVPVKIGVMNDRMVEIVEGLKEGDKIITGTETKILNGDNNNVKVLETKPDNNKKGE
ncbi:efflux RND transporter periplasmic adaptor subunit [Clostridiaceae bacterium M8S5]|nr:efflux RND transporter periplasmic adaptor subunit [Clostridiaceae bacterium M8S5]